LPPAGDCNPYTGTSCFCKEESSQQLFPSEFQQVCVRQLSLSEPPATVGCGVQINNEISLDKECKCKQNNSCFNTDLKALNPKFKIANNVLSAANQGFDLLESGDFQPAKLSSFSTDASAFASKTLKELKRKPLKSNLNPEQQKAASDLAKVLPADIAAALATAPNGNSPVGLGMGGSPKANLDKLPQDLKKKVAEAIKADYNTKGSSTTNPTGEDQPQFQMPTFGQKAADSGTEVVKFAEKAFNNADVNNTPETPIFDIISNRYRRSGWNKVESVEMKAQ